MNGALLGVASTNFAYFYWYSVVRTLYVSSQTLPKPPSTAIELSLGAAAGAIAQIFTIPVSVVTTRQQTQPKGDKKGMLDTGREVINGEDGWTGLWRGLKASLVLVVNPAITYGAYQRLKDVIFPGRISLRPWEAFSRPYTPFRVSMVNLDSAWCHVKVHRNDLYTAFDCRKSRPSIQTSASKARKALQILYRSDELHH